MADIYGKGDKGKALKLHSKIVRARGHCQRCGQSDYSQLQCAHLVTRARNATATDLDNAFCLCRGCHWTFTNNPFLWTDWVDSMIGEDARHAIQAKSVDPAFKAKPAFWAAEVERLRAIWVGLDDHERVTK